MRRVAPTVRQIVAPVLLALVLPACAVEPEAPSGDVPTEPVAVVRDIAVETTVAFTEGPTVAEDGTVYFTDLGNNRIMRLTPAGRLSTFRQPSHRANGLIFDAEWRLLACESGDGDTILPRVTRTNMETGEVEGDCRCLRGQAAAFAERSQRRRSGADLLYRPARPEPATGADRCSRCLPGRPGRIDRAHPDRARGVQNSNDPSLSSAISRSACTIWNGTSVS